jgi:hypothetical protein
MMRNIIFALFLSLVWAGRAVAVPETVSMRVTDVTTSSFAVVWMTDVVAKPNVEVYSDSAMVNSLAGSVNVIAMPDLPPNVAAAATGKGIMKVRVVGLTPNKIYYVRTVTADPANPTSISYSALQQVTTAATVVPYLVATDGTLQGIANDLIAFKIYIRPNDTDTVPGQGDLILMETLASPYPVSAFVGVGTSAPEGVLDLNNLFGTNLTSLVILGGGNTLLTVYRGGTLATLSHYRRFPTNSGTVAVGAPAQGFFADINLDGNVDDQDFAMFQAQFRTARNDPTYNPDYKFVQSSDVSINAQDFASFAQQYGRTGVQ